MIEEYIKYSPETGRLTWIKAPSKNIRAGTEVGTLSRGYSRFQFKGKNYLAHRVAWYLYHGKWPTQYIDHINRDKLDNRIENLRDVDHRENHHNKVNFNFGATYNKANRKWMSKIQIDGSRIHLGYFETEQEAQEAYIGYFRRTGTST